MESLPQHLENKIFYYLRHPVADLLKKQEVILLYPYTNVFSASRIIFLNGFVEDGKLSDSNLNIFLYKNPSYRRSRQLHKYRILRKYLPTHTFEKMKKEGSVNMYYSVFLTGQYNAEKCVY